MYSTTMQCDKAKTITMYSSIHAKLLSINIDDSNGHLARQ